MKTFYIFVFVFITMSLQAQFRTGISYVLGVPLSKMADNINPIHQVNVSGGYTPASFKWITFGAELGAGNYANKRVLTTFNFGNGNPTETYVNYSSNTISTNANFAINFTKDKLFTPYVIVKTGYSKFFSNIFVEDPKDIDGCKALEKKSIIKDKTTTLSYGGGFRYEVGNKSKSKKGVRQFIEFQIAKVKGGDVDYINTRNLLEPHHTNSSNTNSNGGKSVAMSFINVQSNVIHNHYVAEMYTTPLRLVEIKLGYCLQF
jgi:hypothetical protein